MSGPDRPLALAQLDAHAGEVGAGRRRTRTIDGRGEIAPDGGTTWERDFALTYRCPV